LTRIFKSIDYKTNEKAYISLQTGPILIKDANKINISIQNDKSARRTFSFLDNENNIYFGSIYKFDSVYLGPTLDELPEVLSKFVSGFGIEVVDAVNLDGGSASFYFDVNTKLSELSFVGSYFCIK